MKKLRLFTWVASLPHFLKIFPLCFGMLVSAAFGNEQVTDHWRPVFHFAPKINWCNDPNGLVYLDGEYHLFFQFNPLGDTWGHMSWGHAVSENLVDWQELPVAIPEKDGIMAFSGSAVVDWENSSGFGRQALVAIYTGHNSETGFQDQRLAYSVDRGRNWTIYVGNPVLERQSKAFRDPKVIWYKPGGYWVMTVALADDKSILFYHSNDLKAWEPCGSFEFAAASEGLWECPDLFPIRDAEGHTRWILIVNMSGGLHAGTRYWIGQFDGSTFRPDAEGGQVEMKRLDWGPDFFATVTWSDVPESDGRRLAVGWMNNWAYAQEIPTHPWRGAMTQVRELLLVVEDDGRARLIQQPARELKQRFANTGSDRMDVVGDAVKPCSLKQANVFGRQLHMTCSMNRPKTGKAGIYIFENTILRTEIGYDAERKCLYLDRSESSVNMPEFFKGRYEMPIRSMESSTTLEWDIYVDGSLVEVFCEGETLSAQIFAPSGCDGVDVFPDCAETPPPDVKISSFDGIEPLKPLDL